MTSLEDMVASGRNQDAAFIFHSEQRRVLACLKLSEGASRWTLYFISTALSKHVSEGNGDGGLLQGWCDSSFHLVSQSKPIQLVETRIGS